MKNKDIVYDMENIFKFFSNRNLLMWPKSIYTIINDIDCEISGNYKNIINAYLNMLFINKKIKDNLNNIQKDNNLIFFKEYINNILDNKIELYNQLSNNNNNKNVFRNLYRIHCSNYIYTFINQHKIYFPKEIINNILYITSNINFIFENNFFNNYLKKYLLFNLLDTMIDNQNFQEYYKYCRFLFLMNKINNQKDFIPIIYDNNNGFLYFKISILSNNKKEQIFDRLYKNVNNEASIDIEMVHIYIDTILYGKIIKVKNKNELYISDHMNYQIPNIIRLIIHNLLTKFLNNKYKYSYNEMLGFIFKNNFIIENYCKKENNTGTKLILPINNDWLTISSKEIRSMSVKDIDYSLLMNEYEDLLSPIIKFIINIKSF